MISSLSFFYIFDKPRVKVPVIEKIILISDYTYWKLLGCGDNISYIIQKALHDYWKENQTLKKILILPQHFCNPRNKLLL
jgi:hypothetical protein